MRVLYINTVYGRGSTGRIIKELGEAVDREGGEYKVAYGRGDLYDAEHSYRIGNKFGVYLHALLARLTDRSGFYSTHATKKLVRFIRTYHPDTIHLHNLHGYYINIEILFDFLKTEFKGKVIWTLHDCWAFTGHCVHFTYVGCQKWKTACMKCPQKGEYPSSCFLDRSNKNYNDKKRIFLDVPDLRIFTVSNWLRDVVSKSFLNRYPIRCIYNGVDTETFKPCDNSVKKRLDIEDKIMILLISDGWNKRKGFDTILDVIKKSPENYHYVMIGLNNKQIGLLPKNATGIERIWDQETLIAFYSAADVFFSPSIEETFGLVIAEAMLCNTPCLVMNSTACPELIAENSGIAIDVGSTTPQILDAINRIIGYTDVRNDVLRFSSLRSLSAYIEEYQN